MSEPYLVSLAGFTQFERDALAYCFRQAGSREPAYRLVDGASRHDFVVADGDDHAVVGPLARNGHFRRTVFVGRSAAPDASACVSRPIDPLRILSCLDELAAQLRAQPAATEPWDRSQEKRESARANARAATRRARLGNQARDADSVDTVHPVLVLDERDSDRDCLCGLLGVFGFDPCPAVSVDQAAQMLGQQAFEAAFLTVVLDESDGGGAALCRRIKHAEQEAQVQTAVVVVSGTAQQADRVRALLAGGDAVLAKPLGRGDVARALESCNVRLPADPRRR